jgi:hypothetical protein
MAADPWRKKVTSLSTFIIRRIPETLSEDEKSVAIESINLHKNYLLSYEGSIEVFQRLNAFADGTENSDAVYIGTIHGAKGLEWNSVFIIGWEESILPHSLAVNRLDEERRLAYVGITRAKEYLILSHVNKRNGQEKAPSQFLSDLVRRLLEKVRSSVSTEAKDVRPANIRSSSTEENRVYRPTDSEIVKDRRVLMDRVEETRTNAVTEFDAADGLLSHAGYSANKNGPTDQRRQMILGNIFYDAVKIPDFISESVLTQWGKPRSQERFDKLRNSLNSFKSLNEGRQNRSQQAINKWKKDIEYLDNVLSESIENYDES